MYKQVGIKNITFAIHKFPPSAVKVSKVYTLGFHRWVSQDATTYSVVIPFNVRLLIYFPKIAHESQS